MKITLEALTVDASDPVSLARWWAETLGWSVVQPDPAGTEVRPPDEPSASLFFILVEDQKLSKNRLHLDLSSDDPTAAVENLEARGAHRVDVGQPDDVTWVVMQDPEGNEFCILDPAA